jgi:hypothetical protein
MSSFLFNKSREQEGGTCSVWKWERGQITYTHVSKCKNDKNKIKIKTRQYYTI